MSGIDLIPTLIFIFVTSYTPGPNNILSTSMGVLYGYRRSLPFLFGVTFGFSIIMLLCGWLSSLLNQYLPNFTPVIKVLGSAYILYLAYGVYRNTNLLKQPKETKPLRFHNGVLLQFLNPKAIYYGLTVTATFLSPLMKDQVHLVITAFTLGLVSFTAISTWALGGKMIQRFLNTPKRVKIFGIILALALVYTAVDLVGLFSFF